MGSIKDKRARDTFDEVLLLCYSANPLVNTAVGIRHCEPWKGPIMASTEAGLSVESGLMVWGNVLYTVSVK